MLVIEQFLTNLISLTSDLNCVCIRFFDNMTKYILNLYITAKIYYSSNPGNLYRMRDFSHFPFISFSSKFLFLAFLNYY